MTTWPPPAGQAFGEAEVDEAYVAGVADKATALYRGTAAETAVALGELFLHSFYGASVAVYRRVGAEHASMKALARHPELGIPRALVWGSIKYLDQRAEIPVEVSEALSYSHHAELFRVPELALKVRLARSAVRSDLNVRDLRALVARAVGPDEAGRGRRPKARLVRVVEGLDKARAALEGERLTVADVAAVSPRVLAGLRARLREHAEFVAELEGELARLAGPR